MSSDVKATQGKVRLFGTYTLTVDEARTLARDLLVGAFTADLQDKLLRDLYVLERNGRTTGGGQ